MQGISTGLPACPPVHAIQWNDLILLAPALPCPALQVKDPTKSYLSQVTNDNGTVS
jgi:hypothetical protein